MTSEVAALSATAAFIGLTHTLLGPDHYLPFIVMSRAWRWSSVKTAVITVLCGLGHVAGSVAIGATGIFLGSAVGKLEGIESFRGNIAGWLLFGFGTAYFVWGLHRAYKGKTHSHGHAHSDNSFHVHDHSHESEHSHVHTEEAGSPNMTPWIIFTIFVFGPCEPLIPVLMYPAAKSSFSGLLTVTSFFSAATISTMLMVVMGSYFGISKLPVAGLERYSHALAGLTLLLCGGAITFLGF